jgi:tetratricopeptide (TPR) repeat protein
MTYDDFADELAGDMAVPFWAYSDDEDLSDTPEDDPTFHGWDAGISVSELLGPPDDEADVRTDDSPWDQPPPRRTRPSREDVVELLARPHVSWTGCLRAVEAAKAVGAWDLVETAAVRALGVAHRADYQYKGALGAAARQILVAKCATATVDGLADALRDGEARLRAVVDEARRDGRTSLAEAVDGEVQAAAQMLLLLTDPDNSGALAQLAGQLRRHLGRADLAEDTATRGIDVDPDNPAPWVVRAAARADQRNHKGALSDLDQDLLKDNTRAAVTRIRVLRTIGRRREALPLALKTAEREPSKPALTMLRLLASELGDETAQATAERLYEQAHGETPDRPASRLLGLLAAKQLVAEGEHERALLLCEVVAADGPAWKEADDLASRLRSAQPQ